MEETILVECSRQSSLEGTSRNFTQTAEWTCNTGNGIVLDIGDQISVHSGFVSEKGAQAGTIEIKERPRGGLDAFGLPIISTLVSKDIVYQIPLIPPSRQRGSSRNQNRKRFILMLPRQVDRRHILRN